MGILDKLQGITTWSADQSRDWMDRHAADDYTLLDVREPAEYESGHLPGALFIPLSQLSERLDEIPQNKPVLVY